MGTSKIYQVWMTGSAVNRLFSSLLALGGEIGVGIFFIITEYFLSKRNDFKFPKKLVLEVSFYGMISGAIALVIYALHVPLREFNISISGIARSVLIPVTGGSWWFVTAYFFLVLLSPSINKTFGKIERGGTKRVIFSFVFLWFFVYVLGQFALFSELEKAIFFYAIGYFYQSRNEKKKIKSGILSVGLIAFYMVGMIIRSQDASLYANGITGLRFTLGELLITAFVAPVCAYIWFALFESLRFGERKRINKIASTTFGVYLIHESIVGRPLFWYNILNVDTWQYSSVLFPVFALISVAFVFIVCALIDMLREKYILPLQLKVFGKFEV